VTGQLDEFEDTFSGDKKLLALLYDNFLIGCIDTTPQRFLFGLLDDNSGDLHGVYSSSTADSSGVFVFKKDRDATAGQQIVCVYFRQRGGQFDNKCVQDPGNKLRLYGKYSLQHSKDIRKNDGGDAARPAEHGDRTADLRSPIKPRVAWGLYTSRYCQRRVC
jgi:hypothetical protein